MFTFGSLFAGIGGFDLALERSGMRCAWQVEIDTKCQKLLRSRFPKAEVFEDVRSVGAAHLVRVDLICGGFPCQDVSVAGRRAGLAGERSGLWFEFHRVLEELRPDWCLIENVAGLLSSNGGRDFAVILRGLVELGYGVAWRVLDAEYFGVAQRRRRVFIVGHLGDGRSAEVLFESESLSGDSPPRRETGEGIAPSLAARARGGGGLGTDTDLDGGLIGPDLAPSLAASGRGTSRAGESRGQDPLVFESRFARNDRGGPDVIVPPLKAESGPSGKGDGAPLVFDARGGGEGDIAPTLTGDHQDRITDYTAIAIPDPAYSVQGIGSKFGSGRDRQDTFVVGPLGGGAYGTGRRTEDDPNLVVAGTVTGAEGHNGNSNPIPENLVVVGPLAPNAGPRSHDAGNFHSNQGVDAGHVIAAPLRSRQSSPGVGMPGRGGEDDENLVVGPLAPNAGPRSHDAGNFHSNQGVDAGHVRAARSGVRRLTPTEAERLQGFPEVENIVTIVLCGESQKNRVLAVLRNHSTQSNALPVDVDALLPNAPCAEMSSPTGQEGPDWPVDLDVLINLERGAVAIRSRERSLLSVSGAETRSSSLLRMPHADFVRLGALINTTLESETAHGRGVSHLSNEPSLVLLNGKPFVVLSGHEIIEHASGADAFTNTLSRPFMSITCEVTGSSPNRDWSLTTLCSYVLYAIGSFIPEPISITNSWSVRMTCVRGWTSGFADSVRYRMLGNAVCVPVVEWIGRRIEASR